MASRKTECARYSFAAMPACWEPWPENMNAIGEALVRCKRETSVATVRSHFVTCFFSSAPDRAGAAKRKLNWLLLTLVV